MQEDWSGLSTFGVGSVLSVTWRTLFRAPGIFIGFTFMSNLLTAIISIVVNTNISAIASFSSLLINMTLSLVIQGAIAYAVFQVIMGGRASMGESLSKSASKIFALLAVAIFTSLAVGLAGMLLVVPGIILLCMWYISAPACVVERMGPIESLGRSRALTKGYRWHVLGVMMLLSIITSLMNLLFMFLMRALVPDATLRNMTAPIVVGLATLIPNAFANVAPAVTYYRLRMVKESLTMESLANVFD
ncbi:MAG: hypothetical protein LBU13_01165 [Synergistaceae bacterium]|jgi:nitrate reductase NapE component|nr:hypothetical protein [Synergistaceae bacterium]